jgi:hypothetical protein
VDLNQNQEPNLSALPEVEHAAELPQADTSAPLADAPVQTTDTSSGAEDGNWYPHREPSTTVKQDFETASPLDKPWTEDQLLLSLPSDSADVIRAALAARPNVDIADTKQGGEWINALRASEVTVSYKGMLDGATTRQGAAFRQGVASERGILTLGNVKFRDHGDSKMTGERAVLRMRALLGLGTVIRVPLWHSGFWISLKAPSDAALLELNRKLADEKITLGRQTFGMAFANTSVFFAGWVMDFALAHMYDSTLHPDIEGNLRKHIHADDIPLIAWGLACACWPGGFPYARAVLDPEGHEKVIREKLNITKLVWVDNASLTPWQIAHMSKLFGQTMTGTDLERYRKEFTRGQGREIIVNDKLSFTLRSPTMDQYLNSGHKWVNNIVTMVDKAFAQPTNDTIRDQYIYDQGKATNMRQYSHYVESIKVGDTIMDDEETIDSAMDALSSDADVRKAFFDGVRQYIRDSAIAVVAIPATEKEDRSTLPRFPNLLVLDVLSVFFILLVQKTQQIQAR